MCSLECAHYLIYRALINREYLYIAYDDFDIIFSFLVDTDLDNYETILSVTIYGKRTQFADVTNWHRYTFNIFQLELTLTEYWDCRFCM